MKCINQQTINITAGHIISIPEKPTKVVKESDQNNQKITRDILILEVKTSRRLEKTTLPRESCPLNIIS